MLKIINVKPTVLFSASEPLMQLAYLKLRNSGERDLQVQVQIHMEGALPVLTSEQTVKAGDKEIEIRIPDIDISGNLAIQVFEKGGSTPVASWQGLWQPQRKWKVYLIKSSHYDLGYDGRVDHMQWEAAEYMDLARRLCADKAQLHEWHYHIEHMGFMRAYERERKESELHAFINDYLKTGMMTLMGNPSGPHWHWMDYEQIARASYPARREMKDRFGLEVESIGIVDNPSGSWAAYQAFAKSGFKYAFILGNHFRGPGTFKELGLPKLLWLEGPNAKDKILCYLFEAYGDGLWIGQAGGGGVDYVGQAGKELSRFLQEVENGSKYGEYPYDTLLMSNYIDWEIPHEDERILAEWRRKWRYPEINLEDAGKAMKYLEENYRDFIPVLKGDTNNNSADYTSIDPQSQGLKRQVTRLLPFVEGLYLIAALLDSKIQYPAKVFNDLYINLVEYDEHCWPTMLPGTDINIFNTNIVKIHPIKKAYTKVMELMKAPMDVICKSHCAASCNKESTIVIWNSLAHKRSNLVKFQVDAAFQRKIKSCSNPVITALDEDMACAIPVQMLDTGEVAFVAGEIPPYGFKNYSLKVQESIDSYCEELKAGEENGLIILQNRFYRLEISKAEGRVVMLEDRRLKRSLIDPEAPYAFNQWLRVSTGEFGYGFSSKELTIRPIGTCTAYLGRTGPVLAQAVIETEDTEMGAKVITTYTLYNELDHLDISNKVLRMDFLHTPAKDRYKENIFISFPFNVEKPRFRVEHSTGTVDPVTDMLPSNTDFIMLNRWIDVGNEEYGITMVSHEASAMHLGKIMYNQFSKDHIPGKSHLFSYVWSNRMSGITALGTEDYHAELNYSIRCHPGSWIQGDAARFGWEQASPLMAVAVSENGNDADGGERNQGIGCQSFINIDAANIQLTVYKRTEKPGGGYILRLVETQGKDSCNVRIKVHFIQPVKAWLCDLVENDLEELQIDNGTIILPVTSYDMVTVRFSTAGENFNSIRHAEAKVLGDSKVQLEWDYDGDFVYNPPGVNIYRSEDPEFTPTLHTLAAYTEEGKYTDMGLKPGCSYFYYIAPADRNNRQGDLFGPVKVRTTLENRTAPLPLTELGVIPMDINRLTVYWKRSPEPDTAQYEVHRSSRPDFEACEDNLIAVINPDKYWYQTYNDVNVKAGETWYYRVFPVDYAGNIQEYSECISGKTPGKKRLPESRH